MRSCRFLRAELRKTLCRETMEEGILATFPRERSQEIRSSTRFRTLYFTRTVLMSGRGRWRAGWVGVWDVPETTPTMGG